MIKMMMGTKARRWARKGLWLLVILGLLASMPLTWLRVVGEQTAPTVDIVYDYQDLITMSNYHAHPQQFIVEELQNLKEVGVSSLAVFESTLQELELHGRIRTFSSDEIALMQQKPGHYEENYTYVLFQDDGFHSVDEVERTIGSLISRGLSAFDITVRPWVWEGMRGLVIEAPPQEAAMLPLDPDPFTIELIKRMGFHVVVRISDNRPFDVEEMDRLLGELSAEGVRWLVFSGGQVPGYGDDAERSTILAMAELMKKHGIGFATIELLNNPQHGVNKLAYLMDYDVIRLHSILERESALEPEVLADRLVLAVKDRNIRMLYLNGEVRRDTTKAEMTFTIENMIKALRGPEGAVARIQAAGYQIGQAEPFQPATASWERPLMLIVLIGGIALIALMLSLLAPPLLIPISLLGYVGVAGLYLLSSTLAVQATALGVAISAPSLAVIGAMRKIRALSVKGSRVSPLLQSIAVFISAFAVTLIGVVLVIGLLHTIPYMLVLEQFRGVTLLKVVPIALVALYYLMYMGADDRVDSNSSKGTGSGSGVTPGAGMVAYDEDAFGFGRAVNRLKAILNLNIKVFYVVVAGIIAVVGLYYVSRSGNQGQVLPFEQMMRTLLERTLGVRPRTQEFLIGHPLFLLGLYCVYKYRRGLFILIFATIGVLTTVGTFTHIHTPLDISIMRTVYGLLFGTAIGLVAIAVVNVIHLMWKALKKKAA